MPVSYPRFQAPFRAFLERIPAGGRVVVYCHFDADGLAAGALFGREAFRRTSQAPPENFAHGHPQASGGHLTEAEYAVLLRGLGFE